MRTALDEDSAIRTWVYLFLAVHLMQRDTLRMRGCADSTVFMRGRTVMHANKAAIVTGGDSGIGHAISVGLAAAGVAVTINYHRNQAAAEATLRQITQEGGRAQLAQGDVSSVADIQRLVEQTVQAFGRLDVMVNNAGMETRTSLLDTTEHQFDLVIGIDLKSAFFGTQCAARQMIKQGSGG